jgi:hypothetical protein
MSDKFEVGEWVFIPLDDEPYKIIKIYEKDEKEVVDLDDGDNFKLMGRPITILRKIPKRGESK